LTVDGWTFVGWVEVLGNPTSRLIVGSSVSGRFAFYKRAASAYVPRHQPTNTQNLRSIEID
jgi:hypothetical protein